MRQARQTARQAVLLSGWASRAGSISCLALPIVPSSSPLFVSCCCKVVTLPVQILDSVLRVSVAISVSAAARAGLRRLTPMALVHDAIIHRHQKATDVRLFVIVFMGNGLAHWRFAA